MGMGTENGVEKIQLLGGDRCVIEPLPCDKLAAVLVDVIAQIGVNGNVFSAVADDKAFLSEIPKSCLPRGQCAVLYIFLFHSENPILSLNVGIDNCIKC